MNKFIDRIARRAALGIFSTTKNMGLPVPEFVAKHVHYRGIVRVDIGGGRGFRMQSYGHAIENRLYWYGKHGHEPESFLPWLKAAAQAQVVLDIGSNTGLYSLGAAAANASADVYAFEPLPRVAALTQTNASLNDGFKITVRQNAVCDQSATVSLHDPGGDQPASASLNSEFLDCEQQVVEVQGIRIDDFVHQANLPSVDLIKLDVEGVEEIALQGMRETIRRFMPTLFIEVLDTRQELLAELRQLRGLGYAVGDLVEDGIHKFDIDSNTKGSERNLLFTTDFSTFPELQA